jgi:hypothetical protein
MILSSGLRQQLRAHHAGGGCRSGGATVPAPSGPEPRVMPETGPDGLKIA